VTPTVGGNVSTRYVITSVYCVAHNTSHRRSVYCRLDHDHVHIKLRRT